MTLRDWLQIWRERWKVIAAFVVLGVAVAVAITLLTPTSYQASAQVIVNSNASADAAAQAQGAAFAQTQARTYAGTIDSPSVLRYVRRDLGISDSDATLKGRISAAAQSNSSLITVSATGSSASSATKLANSAARGFVMLVEGYTTPRGSSTPGVQLSVTEPATAPSGPTSPKPVAWTLSGLFVGLLLGAGAATLRELTDNRIKTPEALAATAGVAAMGVIVNDPTAARHPIATNNARAENFRQLRANLQFANVDAQPRIIATTSSVPAEGKTMVAMNLAAALAEAEFAVCLVDADLRRPTLARTMGLLSDVGLKNVLVHQIDLSQALQKAGPNLQVLASGPTPPNPSEVLASSYARQVIRSLLDSFDYVVIDTAPLLPVADGAQIATIADGTLLIARHNSTAASPLSRASNALAKLNAPVIGTVLNRAPSGDKQRGYVYGYAPSSHGHVEAADAALVGGLSERRQALPCVDHSRLRRQVV